MATASDVLILTRVRDGDDGQTDGFIQLTVGPSPVYLRLAE
jgi:hypothetical protein